MKDAESVLVEALHRMPHEKLLVKMLDALRQASKNASGNRSANDQHMPAAAASMKARQIDQNCIQDTEGGQSESTEEEGEYI